MPKTTFIDSIRVKDPCTENWDEMSGNDRVRFCSHCSKNVNDISKLTRKQAMLLVRESEGRLCVRYLQDPKTNAPIFADRLYQISRSAPLMAAGVMTASLSLAAMTYAQGCVDAVPSQPPPAASRLAELKECDGAAKSSDTGAAAFGRGNSAISGTVTDAMGAVVPGRDAILLDRNGTELSRKTSDLDGTFKFDGLEPGSYNLKFEPGNGFRGLEVQSIKVEDSEVGQSVTLELEDTITMGVVAFYEEIEYKNPLSIAIQNDDLDELRNHIAAGANVNGKEEDNSTPLFVAVRGGNIDMVRLLLDYGAKVNARDKEKMTPLMMLDDDASRELVELLISSGAKVNLVSKDGSTALVRAAGAVKPEVLQALIDAGGEINAQDENGQTALMNAANFEDLESVRVLLLAGAEVNLKNKDGETAWDLTTDTEVEELLVSFGAVVEDETVQDEPQ